MPRPSIDVHAHSADIHGLFPLLHGYMTEVAAPRVREPRSGGRPGRTLIGLLERATDSVGSLVRLGQATDLLAAGACARALFETMIDVVFVTRKPGSAERLLDWEISETMRLAKQFAKAPGQPDVHGVAAEFIRENEERVKEYRSQFPNGDHPRRWNNRSVEADAREADSLLPPEAQLMAGALMEWRWKLLNWATHGSTLVGIRFQEPTSRAAWMSAIYMDGFHCGLACANLALDSAGWLGDEAVEQRRLAVIDGIIAILGQHHPDQAVQESLAAWRHQAQPNR